MKKSKLFIAAIVVIVFGVLGVVGEPLGGVIIIMIGIAMLIIDKKKSVDGKNNQNASQNIPEPQYNPPCPPPNQNVVPVNNQPKSTEHFKKGKSLVKFPSDFTVIDIETTGRSTQYDKIIEISALRIRGMEIVDQFSVLINPEKKLPKTVINITGITDDMLSSAPTIDYVIPKFDAFIGNDIIIGHNVSFDINFLFIEFERILNKPLSNDFVDTLKISRKFFPDLEHHKLSDIAKALNIQQNGAHRGLYDCQTTLDCYTELYKRISETGIDDFINSFKRSNQPYQKFAPSFDVRTVTAKTETFDETHPLFNKRCVFTGELNMPRSEAAQIVANFGGICEKGVTLKTDFLILGDNGEDHKSGKQKKAEEYIQRGTHIKIIGEDEFYQIIGK